MKVKNNDLMEAIAVLQRHYNCCRVLLICLETEAFNTTLPTLHCAYMSVTIIGIDTGIFLYLTENVIGEY